MTPPVLTFRTARMLVLPWLLLIAVLSLYPLDTLTMPTFRFADKVAHVLMYAATCALFILCFSVRTTRMLFSAAACSAGFGLLMEVAQGMTRYRFFSLADALANLIGAAAVALLWSRAAGGTEHPLL